ncbi:uncharacterized protein [Antedon mediterranea]|uniref:uncharacterized protein n=1 Tax=Antedon mediterranea TaxID=105859 RepID=UPI003AF7E390
MMTTSKFTGGIERRREEMYGDTKFDRLNEMKHCLTTDNVSKIHKEGSTGRWESTTKTTYIVSKNKGRQPAEFGVPISSSFQRESHFTMRADGSKIDDAIYKSSIAMKDYNKKSTEIMPTLKPDRTINLADMQPRYWKDNRFGSSLYRTDFSNMVVLANEGSQTQEMKDLKEKQNELRRHNIKDVRKSHFSLGYDQSKFSSETCDSYFNTKLDTNNGDHEDTPAMFTKKMVEDEQNSAVFRHGDYNFSNILPSISTFNRDYNATIKPLKAAGFIEVTKSKKGRFLDRAPRQERNEVLLAYNQDSGSSASEPSRTQREEVCSTLKQICMQYDLNKNGYISKDALIRASNCLLDPIPQNDFDDILRVSKRGMSGTIDYNDFIKQYLDYDYKPNLEEEIVVTAHDPKESFNFDDIPGLESTDGNKSTSWPPKTTQGNPLLVTSELGKDYQTTAHFKFGHDGENPASIYRNDFDMKGHQTDQELAKPPISSEVMHKSENPEFGKSTKQTDYITFRKETMNGNDEMAKKNKSRHSKNSVHLACDEKNHMEDRQTSVARSSFIKHQNTVRQMPITAQLPKYRYLDTAALPYSFKTPRSEAKEAFSNLTSPEQTITNLSKGKLENNARTKDQRKVHFQLGSDEPSAVSESHGEFIRCRSVGNEVPSAGKKNMYDPRFNHITASKNTQDLQKNPMSWNTFDTLRMNKKGYFNGQSSSMTPLHLSLQRAFSELDPDGTGKITKEHMKDICRNYKLNISQISIEALLRKCDRYDDGNVNYQVFLKNLTPQQVPEGVSAAHSDSTMSNDFRPLQQRSFTDAQLRTISHMNKKPTLPQSSHLFHMDENRGNNFISTMNQDFLQPEIQPRTWIPSDAC